MGQNRKDSREITSEELVEQYTSNLGKRTQKPLGADEQSRVEAEVNSAKRQKLSRLSEATTEILKPLTLEIDQSSDQEETSSSEESSPAALTLLEEEVTVEALLNQLAIIEKEKALYEAAKQAEIDKLVEQIAQVENNKQLVDVAKEGQKDLSIETIKQPEVTPSINVAMQTDSKEKDIIESKLEEEDAQNASPELINEESEERDLYDDSRDLHFFTRFDLVLTENNMMEELRKISIDKPNANRLNLNMTKLNTESLKQVITFLKKHEEIIDLSLCDTGLQPMDIKLLATFLEDSKIEKINLSQAEIDQDAMKCLMSSLSEASSNISYLSLGGVCTSGEVMSIVMDYLPKTKINHLKLGGNNISDETINRLTESIRKLKSLDLYCNDIEDEGALILAKLINNSNIKHLNMCSNELTEVGCKLLGNLICTPEDLEGNPGAPEY